ncbi:MAG: hypothetical protein KIT31_10890 [Deltaproteobacteria bacterium]|nr:hypothetical protein [Deltaproteobacteria bacterium]
MKLPVFLSLAALAFAPLATALADQPPPPPRPRRPPPPAAFEACAKAKAGDACAFQLHDHAIRGTCTTVPDATTLACRPDQPPPPPPPPQAALDACNGKADGDACAFQLDGHALSGACWRPDASRPLACRPPHP